ncbi:MAG: methyl-accepting chemotaxis protein, partial [Lachnospiraceae bacterium]|nr:methyl-accepting chemotaxis protein [Lachnospiraceae bacterium]
MHFKKISTKLLVLTLPLIILALVLLTVISTRQSRVIITEKTNDLIDTHLSLADASITEQFTQIISAATSLSETIGVSHDVLTQSDYEELLNSLLEKNSIAVGNGVWLEPYVFDPAEKYFGPYVYRGDGGKLILTYEYSNAEYDYLSRPYYTISQGLTEPVLTDPYFDEGLGTSLSTCSVAIYDYKTKKYIGCASVGISLQTVTDIINNIHVGETGSAILLTGSGSYIAGVDVDKVSNGLGILDEDNPSLVSAGQEILANDSGETFYIENGERINLYYTTMDVGEKLVIRLPLDEINKAVDKLRLQMILVCIFFVLLTSLVIFLTVSNIASGIKKVQDFSGKLADGDFSVDTLKVSSKDEVANMSEAMNTMYTNNRNIIQQIANNSKDIGESSNKLSEASKDLRQKFAEIEKYMGEVNESMLSTSAATEDVNASTEEVR